MKDSKAQLQKLVAILQRYAVVICFAVFGAMYAYLIYASSQQTVNEPPDREINEKFQGTKRPKVDDSAARTLQQLEDQNIEVRALFDEARNNPFDE